MPYRPALVCGATASHRCGGAQKARPDRNNRDALTLMRCARRLLLGWLEIFQVGRRLARPGGREKTLIADEIILLAEHDVVIVLGANELVPHRIGLAMVAARHGPGAGQGMVGRGDLVVQEIGIALVEI